MNRAVGVAVELKGEQGPISELETRDRSTRGEKMKKKPCAAAAMVTVITEMRVNLPRDLVSRGQNEFRPFSCCDFVQSVELKNITLYLHDFQSSKTHHAKPFDRLNGNLAPLGMFCICKFKTPKLVLKEELGEVSSKGSYIYLIRWSEGSIGANQFETSEAST